MVAYTHFRLIENSDVEIEHYIVADVDIAAIVAAEGLVYDNSLAAAA